MKNRELLGTITVMMASEGDFQELGHQCPNDLGKRLRTSMDAMINELPEGCTMIFRVEKRDDNGEYFVSHTIIEFPNEEAIDIYSKNLIDHDYNIDEYAFGSFAETTDEEIKMIEESDRIAQEYESAIAGSN